VYLTADAKCEFKKVQECETSCSTTSVEQVCAQKTYTTCGNRCTESASTSCTKTQSDSCSKEFATISTKSSREVCVSKCSDSCTADAVSGNRFDGDHDKCQKNCSHDCNARCDSSSSSDQSTDCETKCQSVVENVCVEEVNRDCVLDCQTNNYEDCETETVNTCNTTCKDKGGALFCDGQFIGASNVRDCADQLATEFSMNIDIAVDAVTGTTKDCVDSAKTKCSFSPPTPGGNGALALGALAALGAVVARRRRRA